MELTDELLAEQGERWCELAEGFDPLPNEQGLAMTNWLRKNVRAGSMPLLTRALYNDHLLGFFAVNPNNYYHVADDPAPLLAARRLLRRAPRRRGLLLANIVRSASRTDRGFGRYLIEHAVGLALEIDAEHEPISALLVRPANPRLVRLWREDHLFDELEKSDRLHLPVKPRGELG